MTALQAARGSTIQTAAEIVVLHSAAMVSEITRRAPDGRWSEQPDIVDVDGELRLDSIGFAARLCDAYRTSGLTA